MKKKFSIGEIANLTGVTIRTLQYYDNIGLVPLEKDTNGRRYYKEADMTKLQQVLFYKSLGLPIKEIKDLVVEAVTTDQVSSILHKQSNVFYQKLNEIKMHISLLEVSLTNLKEYDTLPMGELVQLMISLNNDNIFKYKDVDYEEDTMDVFKNYYENPEEIINVYWSWKSLILEAVTLVFNDVEPESDQGQRFAKKWVQMVEEITSGDNELLEAHKTSYDKREQWPKEDRKLMEFANGFIDKAVQIYLTNK